MIRSSKQFCYELGVRDGLVVKRTDDFDIWEIMTIEIKLQRDDNEESRIEGQIRKELIIHLGS